MFIIISYHYYLRFNKIMQYINKASSITKKIKNISVPRISTKKLTSIFTKSNNQQGQTSLKQKIDSLLSEKQSILPTSKMQQIANYSYCQQNFYVIIDLLNKQLTLRDFQFTKRKCRNIRNLLILMGYLLRHGVGGFIDEFRYDLQILKQLSQLQMANGSLSQQYMGKIKKDKQLLYLVQQIKQRAHYIIELLTDKAKMLKEKQLANLIKQKMQQSFIQKQKQIQNQYKYKDYGVSQQGQQRKLSLSIQHCDKIHKTKMQRAEDFLNNYLFKFINKADEKLDALSDAIVLKIDEYLVGDIPEEFQIDQMQQIPKKQQQQIADNVQISIQQQRQFVNKRLKKMQQEPIKEQWKPQQVVLLVFEDENETQSHKKQEIMTESQHKSESNSLC